MQVDDILGPIKGIAIRQSGTEGLGYSMYLGDIRSEFDWFQRASEGDLVDKKGTMWLEYSLEGPILLSNGVITIV